MVKLAKALSCVAPCKVLVIGDFLLDTYTVGKARRISPEAPVAVLHVNHEEHRPGGAGNVALNLISLGCEVLSVGRIGADSMGEKLRDALISQSVDVRGLKIQKDYQTPVKNRVIADSQQIVRIDHENITSIDDSLEQELHTLLPKLLEGVDVIAISDYGKGFLSSRLLSKVILEGKKRKLPIIADPKGVDFTKYAGATIIKPNLGETYAAANLLPDAPLEHATNRILEQIETEILMVTRSEEGISLFYREGKREDYPVTIREVVDVTGAGDTVLAVLAWSLANKLSMREATELSNISAGIAIERFGCARITLSELARRLLEKDVENKVFDVDHLFALIEALRGRRCILLSVTSQEGLTSAIFQAIRTIKLNKNTDLIVFVRDDKPCNEFVEILTTLHDVDFLILSHENLCHLCARLAPEEVYTVEDDNCRLLESSELAEVIL